MASDAAHGQPFLYLNVDQLPSFSHENHTATEFIYENLVWPKDVDVEGDVIVSFVVDKNGKIRDIRIERSLELKCDQEVQRVLNSMPKWEPSKVKGQPVDTILYLPISFRLGL